MKNKEQLNSYKKTGHLLNKKIVCTECTTHITCFGTNLEGKIAKYGGIETLLETFKCRSCVSASKPKKVKKVTVKRAKKKDVKIESYEVPKLKPYVSREVALKDSPELVSEMTENGVCIRPDIYLDFKRCDDCPYVKNCNATCKTLKYVTA